MPYYRGDYYRGDNNYAAGGLFSFIGKAAKTAFNVLAPAPLKAAVNLFRAPAPTTRIGSYVSEGSAAGYIRPPEGAPEPGATGMAHRFFPGGSSGYGYYNKKGEFVEGKRPRMNPLNQRALSRAGRRVKGFLRIASRLGALPINRGKGKKLFKKKRR